MSVNCVSAVVRPAPVEVLPCLVPVLDSQIFIRLWLLTMLIWRLLMYEVSALLLSGFRGEISAAKSLILLSTSLVPR